MTEQTREHLTGWILNHVAEADQFATYSLIYTFCLDYPDLPESRTWTEIRALAERNADSRY